MNPKRKTIAILGAGISGLAAAYYLSESGNKVIVIEKSDMIGGSAAGFQHKDFILDYGPHKLYTELPGIMEEIRKVTPLLKIKKKNSIFLKGRYFDFPLSIKQVAFRIPLTAVNSGFDMVAKTICKRPDDSYENFLINRFGKTLYSLAFRDYAEKVWNSDPKELDRELAKKRVAVSSIFALIKSILFKDTKKISAEYFYYPPYGIIQLIESLKKRIIGNNGKILLNSKISKINLKGNSIDSIKIGNKTLKVDYLISTVPLDDFISLINAPEHISDSASGLKYQKLNIIYFILDKERALKDCWVFFPEKKFIFQRISEQKAFSPHTSPKGKTVLMVETTKEADEELIKKIIRQLESIGALKQEEIEEYFVKSYQKAYPIYKKGFSQILDPVIEYLESIQNLYTIGRQGLFNYNNMDQCWDMAMKTADQIENGRTKEHWQKTKRYFNAYRIVD